MEDMVTDSAQMADTIQMGHSMTHSFSLELLMMRNGSGTGWLPDASPMFGYMAHAGKWMFMGHGSMFLRYTVQDVSNSGHRGSDQLNAPNWFMFMGQRKVGRSGQFRFASMISLDPLTVGGYGYPLLFQSGESWEGKPLIDRQHPHDLFSELSIAYTQRFATGFEGFVYVGYPGEPALGTTAFMHRTSALYNPDAPLGHHSQDATHIVFDTATAGLRYKFVKLEGSLFTGREPDENRYAFQEPTFDSWSVRASASPSRNFVLQAGYGAIASPEELEAEADVQRTTASVLHTQPVRGGRGWISTTAVWGMNRTTGGHDAHDEHSMLLESTLSMGKNAVYGRYEWVQRAADELQLPTIELQQRSTYNINVVSLGYNRTLLEWAKSRLAVGAQFSLHFIGTELEPVYGTNPVSGQVYVQVYPGRMNTSTPHSPQTHQP